MNPTAAPGDIDRRLEEFRAVRERIEASILPLATSVDGRSFTFQASLHGLDLQPGELVQVRSAAEIGRRLKCGTNCGSCVPEIQAIAREAVAQA